MTNTDELRELDKFMFSIGFGLYPSIENDKPTSTRYYRHETLELVNGEPCTYHMTLDSAKFWHKQSQRIALEARIDELDKVDKDDNQDMFLSVDAILYIGNRKDELKSQLQELNHERP